MNCHAAWTLSTMSYTQTTIIYAKAYISSHMYTLNIQELLDISSPFLMNVASKFPQVRYLKFMVDHL